MAFLVDVDDTLLDNDRIRADFEEHLEGRTAPSDATPTGRSRSDASSSWDTATTSAPCRSGGRRRTWIRACSASPSTSSSTRSPTGCTPGRSRSWRACGLPGTTVVLTDGDAIFQPRKIARAGIRDAADDVLVYVHKEEELDDVERRHPAERYVLVDDKVRILSAAKRHGPTA